MIKHSEITTLRCPEFFSTAAPEGYTEIKLTDFIPSKRFACGRWLIAIACGKEEAA